MRTMSCVARKAKVWVTHTLAYVVENCMISPLSLHQRLPQVMVGVDETWTNYLVSTIHDFDLWRRYDVTSNLYDEIPIHQQISRKWDDVVTVIMG